MTLLHLGEDFLVFEFRFSELHKTNMTQTVNFLYK